MEEAINHIEEEVTTTIEDTTEDVLREEAMNTITIVLVCGRPAHGNPARLTHVDPVHAVVHAMSVIRYSHKYLS